MTDEHHLDLDGRRLSWRVDGSGPALLLLQGYAGSADDWDPTFLAELAASFLVVRPDPRGIGQADLGELRGDDAVPYTVSGLAEDALAVLDACGLDRAVVVGFSMGGFVAQALCSTAPERVDALVLISTDPGGSQVAFAAPEVWARLIDHAGDPRHQAERLLELIFPPAVLDALGPDRGELVDLVAEARRALDPAALLAQEAAMDAWHRVPPPSVPADVPPVVAVAGDDDVVIPAANVALLAQRWPGCRVERIAGAGHAVMAQEPQRVAALVRTAARSAGAAPDVGGAPVDR